MSSRSLPSGPARGARRERARRMVARAAHRATGTVSPLVRGRTTYATLVAVAWTAQGREAVPPPRPADLLQAGALGAASGCRSVTGIAAVARTSRADDTDPVASRLATRTGSTWVTVAAAGEILADKLPGMPSRLEPAGLVPRAALGATAAAAVARRDGHGWAVPGLVGAAAAVAAAAIGTRLRAAAARRCGSDLPGALAEDVLAALLGWLGARRPDTAGLPETTERPLNR